jgi:hypothetical protein
MGFSKSRSAIDPSITAQRRDEKEEKLNNFEDFEFNMAGAF